MSSSRLQITIRGLDPDTKTALAKKAAQKGMSLNKYAVESLKQIAGAKTSEERYQEMKQFLSRHYISKEDVRAIDEAVAWSDRTSLDKQRREERDLTI